MRTISTILDEVVNADSRSFSMRGNWVQAAISLFVLLLVLIWMAPIR